LLVPSEVAPPDEVHALRHELIRRDSAVPTNAVAAALLDPLLQARTPGLTKAADPTIHRQIWTTPHEALLPEWRRELARLEMRTA
jgi:hypothetical protein